MLGHLVLKGEKVSLYTITKGDLKKIWEYFGDFEFITKMKKNGMKN